MSVSASFGGPFGRSTRTKVPYFRKSKAISHKTEQFVFKDSQEPFGAAATTNAGADSSIAALLDWIALFLGLIRFALDAVDESDGIYADCFSHAFVGDTIEGLVVFMLASCRSTSANIAKRVKMSVDFF
ncbi:glycosyl transferase [Anopheles sinensis]|uniref:Glycosyl transferase n=1 Tax=Anopheles sinensis TaxID=74873 RepID=A0A084VWU7_ANOSI|nr:glycosyl transferase [Anopheles sinensis]